ncbi:MAG TPA: hypothetical protein VLL52_21150 [Anaerolineae bacterium]|nr:hypothetical protein [Anaerolineae bacterium]
MNNNTTPNWQDAPPEFQTDLDALQHLSDNELWQITRAQHSTNIDRHQYLLDQNANGNITPTEQTELTQLRTTANRFMLRKAYAAALLKSRGHAIPPADQL